MPPTPSFTPLTQRLAKALQIPGLGDRENPFHPVRFCRALGDAIDKLGFKGDQRHAVLKAFDVSLLKPLVAVYTALNNELEGKGVQEGGAASSYKPHRLSQHDDRFSAAPRHLRARPQGGVPGTRCDDRHDRRAVAERVVSAHAGSDGSWRRCGSAATFDAAYTTAVDAAVRSGRSGDRVADDVAWLCHYWRRRRRRLRRTHRCSLQ